ncbi:hypothetical protein [Enhydrobacter sp.]|jgi:hypothetical protein|uniref:hypothetical protein n=1 Tax=Enhydrobacter sp. TaxID=1894999 RepID=UPI00263006BE|nr:hypothetical protein [Enhydrobacter sp.]WIM09303.1 MAG: hypothetical protein OJF58_000254 [Enhydrobacter sp.]
MSDNVISLDKRRRDKAAALDAAVLTPSAEEIAAGAVVAAQVAADQEERGRMHMALVNATTQVLDARPLSIENRLDIARGIVRAIMGPGWKIVRK